MVFVTMVVSIRFQSSKVDLIAGFFSSTATGRRSTRAPWRRWLTASRRSVLSGRLWGRTPGRCSSRGACLTFAVLVHHRGRLLLWQPWLCHWWPHWPWQGQTEVLSPPPHFPQPHWYHQLLTASQPHTNVKPRISDIWVKDYWRQHKQYLLPWLMFEIFSNASVLILLLHWNQ